MGVGEEPGPVAALVPPAVAVPARYTGRSRGAAANLLEAVGQEAQQQQHQED
jgi:hypothetical protein